MSPFWQLTHAFNSCQNRLKSHTTFKYANKQRRFAICIFGRRTGNFLFNEKNTKFFNDFFVAFFTELNTPDALEYNFYPFRNGIVQFRVRAGHDAHLALTGEPNETHPIIEVFIGGWKNTKSVIRYNKAQPEVAECGTPDILSGNEFRGFWIRVTDGVSSIQLPNTVLSKW